MLLTEHKSLFAYYEKIEKTHEQHRFMYWFMLKVAGETILNQEKTQAEKEEFAREMLSAFEKDFKVEGE